MTICKIIVWNNNLQKRCPEQQFPKIWPERPLTKKAWSERKFAEKGVHNTNLQKAVQNNYLRKNKLSRTTVCRICKKNDLSQLFVKAV